MNSINHREFIFQDAIVTGEVDQFLNVGEREILEQDGSPGRRICSVDEAMEEGIKLERRAGYVNES